MAADGKKLQPIIIKRVKKNGHAAHGGAWKIAYADFVTAMMAFFLLMWLLGSTTEGDKKGISDYFQSPLKVAFFGGSGAGDASSIVKGGGKDLTEAPGQTRKGTPESAEVEEKKARLRMKAQVRAEQAVAEKSRLESLQQRMEEVLANSPALAPYMNQIRLDMTRDGLRIQIVDDQSRPMFDSGSAAVKPYMRDILRAIGSVLDEVPNKITLRRAHRCVGLQRRWPWLHQLGAVLGPRQFNAPRVDVGRAGPGQGLACARAGREQPL